MILFKESQVAGLWEKIRESADYADFREQLLAKHDEIKNQKIETLLFSEFRIFRETGSRKEFQRNYYKRRCRLNTYAALSLIYGDAEYISALEDVIWAICDEYTWSVPAHLWKYDDEPNYTTENLREKMAHIDLFASETGFALSEILYLLGDKLSSEVVVRTKMELERRIINSFASTSFHWETAEHNWAAVCIAGVVAAYVYHAPDRFDEIFDRVKSTTECFLRSFNNDGACLEGISYWNYGFGFYTYYAALIEEFNGTPMFDGEKMANIAKFQERSRLNPRMCISFSDSSPGAGRHSLGLTHYLRKRFGIQIPPKENASLLFADSCYRWATFIRAFAWCDPGASDVMELEPMTYFKDSEIFIARKPKFSFAAKGGFNQEPHNHNDVGGFIFAAPDGQIFVDLGMGEYTREYFGATRYEFFVNSSRGHNLPIINGEYQQFGEEYAGKVLRIEDNIFEVDIAKAYAVDGLQSAVRRFEIGENGVKVIGEYKFLNNGNSIAERLISEAEPLVENGAVKVKDAVVKFSPEMFNCKVSSETYSDHSANPKTVYITDLVAKSSGADITAEYEIQI